MLVKEYGAVYPDKTETITPARHSDNFRKFLQLVRDGMKEPVRKKWDPHWAPQTQLLAMFRRYIPIDLVGRLEAFTPAMAYVLEIGEVKRPVDLSVRFNEGPKPPYRLQEIMTPAILEALLDLYGEDIEHFGYGEAVKAIS